MNDLNNEQPNNNEENILGSTPDEQPQNTAYEEEAIEETGEIENNPDLSEPQTFEKPNDDFAKENVNPTWEKVKYSDVSPMSDYQPASKGLKVFAFILAIVILISGGCATGYFMGKNSSSVSKSGQTVKVDLSAKPKNKDQYTAAEVYDKVAKSVVGIRAYNSQGAAMDGSGVFYSDKGYIVTNDHLYANIGAPKFIVHTYDGKEYTASYVAGDTVSDIAILKLNKKIKVSLADFGNNKEMAIGENVVTIGKPNDAVNGCEIKTAVISLNKRRVTGSTSYSQNLIQIDKTVASDVSGGALVNMYGQVIGITTTSFGVQTDEGAGFAIPSTTVKRVAEQLIKNGKVTDRAKLGITYTELGTALADVNKSDNIGLYVASVSEDSDAYGKLKEGDIITKINGTQITNDDIVLDIIEQSKAGDVVSLTVLNSKGKTINCDVKLKANIGESSYSSKESIPSGNSSGNSSQGSGSDGGTFNFPYGE